MSDPRDHERPGSSEGGSDDEAQHGDEVDDPLTGTEVEAPKSPFEGVGGPEG